MSSSVPVEPGGVGPRRASLEALIRSKRPRPVASVEELMAEGEGVFDSDDEVDEFVTAVREWRRRELGEAGRGAVADLGGRARRRHGQPVQQDRRGAGRIR